MENTSPSTAIEHNKATRTSAVKIIKIMLTAVVVVFALVAIWPRGRLVFVWALGRCNTCSFRDTLNSHDLLVNMARDGEQIGKTSHVLLSGEGFELVETPRGNYWTAMNDKFLRFTLAEEDLEIYGSNEHGVKPGDVVLDCGANVGVFTRKALKQGARLVVAIEPAPRTVECLRRNFEREIADGHVIVYPKGVWDHVDTLELALGPEGNTTGNSFVLGRSQKSKVKVDLTTIDRVVAELHLNRVDFIKMDIEGAEKEALRGARETLRRFRPRLAISAYHLKEDPVEIPALVRDLDPGYRGSCGSCVLERRRIAPKVLFFASSDVAYSQRDAVPSR